jgi:signal transduction histidine kinase
MRDFVQEVQGRALEKKIHIELEMLNAPRVYFFDSQLIKRALSNLIQNAISHSPEQAVIRLSVSRHREALRFEVQDAGPGIAQDLRDQLFNEPTERSRDHAEGTNKGLGLVIVRRIAEAHGGRVWLDSSNHPGAKFCIEIKPMH